eukprot:scaffold36796_cov26-Phaeocystis_antarctica.AAC.1
MGRAADGCRDRRTGPPDAAAPAGAAARPLRCAAAAALRRPLLGAALARPVDAARHAARRGRCGVRHWPDAQPARVHRPTALRAATQVHARDGRVRARAR